MNTRDYQKYLEYIESGQLLEAVKLKNANIPTVMHKYFSLSNDYTLNASKIQYISENKVYLSTLNSFNDPFEGKFLIFNQDKLAQEGWDIDLIYDYYDNLRNFWHATCLSDTNEQNMPMWAYYANNHQGFCAEYILSDMQKKYIFPVSYESERQCADSIVTRVINAFGKFKYEGIEPDGKNSALLQCLLLSLAAKHKSWKHENEYRIIHAESHFPIIASKIYIGLNCKTEYVQKLLKIGEASNGLCHVYQMALDRDDPNFELQKVKLI